MTKEQKNISQTNRKAAWDYFVSIGEIPKDASKLDYALHHIDPSWIENDIERYIQWNIQDLIVMKYSEHVSFHWTLDHDERCRKISASLLGNDRFKGHKHSEETRKRMSESQKAAWLKRKNLNAVKNV